MAAGVLRDDIVQCENEKIQSVGQHKRRQQSSAADDLRHEGIVALQGKKAVQAAENTGNAEKDQVLFCNDAVQGFILTAQLF